jgi:predicted nucleic acid-binding protein
LLDTFYIQAVLNPDDAYHARALALVARIENAAEAVVTEAVLVEVGDALSDKDRGAAVEFIRSCYVTSNITVVPVTASLLARALERYEDRPDKTWGLTDCLSFIVMEDFGMTAVATGDRHFRQAGFDTLL